MAEEFVIHKRPRHNQDDDRALRIPLSRIKLSKCLVISVCLVDYDDDTPFADRIGADKDIQHIGEMFAGDDLYHNDGRIDGAQLNNLLKHAQSKLIKQGDEYDGFVMVMSGHGVASKMEPSALSCFVASDGSMKHVSDILHMFRNGPGALGDSFLGKPRIFVLEACRDAEAVVAADEHEEKVGGVEHKAFNQDDGFYVIRSSTAGTASYRTEDDGSLLIKAVSQVFNFAAAKSRSFSIDDAVYLVKREVSQMAQGKQEVLINSTLNEKVLVRSEPKDDQKVFDPSQVKALPADELYEDGLEEMKLIFKDSNPKAPDCLRIIGRARDSHDVRTFRVSCQSDTYDPKRDMMGIVLYFHKNVNDGVLNLQSFKDYLDGTECQPDEWGAYWKTDRGMRCRNAYVVMMYSDTLMKGGERWNKTPKRQNDWDNWGDIDPMSTKWKESKEGQPGAVKWSKISHKTLHGRVYYSIFGEWPQKEKVSGAGFAWTWDYPKKIDKKRVWKFKSSTFNYNPKDGFHGGDESKDSMKQQRCLFGNVEEYKKIRDTPQPDDPKKGWNGWTEGSSENYPYYYGNIEHGAIDQVMKLWIANGGNPGTTISVSEFENKQRMWEQPRE